MSILEAIYGGFVFAFVVSLFYLFKFGKSFSGYQKTIYYLLWWLMILSPFLAETILQSQDAFMNFIYVSFAICIALWVWVYTTNAHKN
tara:strand:+ start:108 stop:371 length:264 start_codon:yes stop_codon:yes gene_type:complete